MDRTGYLDFQKIVKKEAETYNYRGELIRFTNLGQNTVLIDQSIILKTGESYTEADDHGKGIDHEYEIEFITVLAPRAINTPEVYGGNHLIIRRGFRKNQGHGKSA